MNKRNDKPGFRARVARKPLEYMTDQDAVKFREFLIKTGTIKPAPPGYQHDSGANLRNRLIKDGTLTPAPPGWRAPASWFKKTPRQH